MRLKIGVLIALCLGLSVFMVSSSAQEKKYREWRQFGGGPENIHYSTLDQITRENVNQLEVAWTYESGDAFQGSEMQCNPIVVDGVLYATTPKLRLIALDGATGALKWSFDPNLEKVKVGKMRNRGVMYWRDPANGAERIYFGFRQYFYSIDAKTGKADEAFGQGGRIDLREGLGRPIEGMTITNTTPGAIYKDMIIIGSLVSEGLPSAPGDIRAFDLRTGKQRWAFHTIPHPGEFGYDTWPKDGWQYLGGANNWSGLVVDEKRGLLFVPTGSAAFDFYGGNRAGDNLFANTLLCLDANTGQRKWHFQAIKHDVWDRDFPTAPLLVTLKKNGRTIDAVAQATKSGHVLVFDRVTGKPIYPIEMRKVATDGPEGEHLASMQAFPYEPLTFARQRLTANMLTNRTPEAHAYALEKFKTYRSEGQFTPPSSQGTIIFPGYDGGAEWGGQAFDPETGWLYVNANEMAWILRVFEKPAQKELPSGKSLYSEHCAGCHLENMRGTPPEFPSLVGISKKLDEGEIRGIIRQGAGRMPGFARLGADGIRALAHYIVTGEDIKTVVGEGGKLSPIDQKFTFDGYNKFLDAEGYPAIAPPWGTLNALDLNAGKLVWQIPFGEYPELAAKGMKNTGTENYGGGIVTKNGLFFIGATNFDKKFRVLDKRTGQLLWEYQLPAAGNATPAMYEVNGRQFIVIAAGGGKTKDPSGGSYIAFALKRK